MLIIYDGKLKTVDGDLAELSMLQSKLCSIDVLWVRNMKDRKQAEEQLLDLVVAWDSLP